MPEKMEIDTAHPVELDSGDLTAILGYIARIRALKAAVDDQDKPAGLQPRRDELKALVNARRALRRAPISSPAGPAGAPSPPPPAEEGGVLPELYGNHGIIPEDWRPAPRTAEWAIHYLQEQGVAFDMAWLVAEFISYWRGREKAMASWQQAFRNNILTKHARAIPLAPPHPRTGPGAGNGRVPGERIYDWSAELRRQRLAHFDLEARGYQRSDPVGSPPHCPVGPDD
jgi:DnaT DNA-binding domain